MSRIVDIDKKFVWNIRKEDVSFLDSMNGKQQWQIERVYWTDFTKFPRAAIAGFTLDTDKLIKSFDVGQ
jgi:hypothetical protein